jgi:hypothetical protein
VWSKIFGKETKCCGSKRYNAKQVSGGVVEGRKLLCCANRLYYSSGFCCKGKIIKQGSICRKTTGIWHA